MSKPESLQAAAKNATPLKMPAIFSGPVSKIESRAWAPCISFAHPKRKDEWDKIQGKFGTVNEGDMYFVYKNVIEHLPVAKLAFITATQYWCSKSPVGELLGVSLKEKPHPFKEAIEAVVLAYIGDRIYPANMQFRTTKCPAAKILSDALIEASTPKWGEKSAAHAETMILNQPFLRFYGEVSLGNARPSKASGLPYRPTQCVIKPTTLAEFRAIKAFQDNPETQTLMDMVGNRYESQIKELKTKEIA